MYVTGREIIPTQGRLQDAMAFVTTMTGSMNEKFIQILPSQWKLEATLTNFGLLHSGRL